MLSGPIDLLTWSSPTLPYTAISDRRNLDSWDTFPSAGPPETGRVVTEGGSRLFSFSPIVAKYEFREIGLSLSCSASVSSLRLIGSIVFRLFGLGCPVNKIPVRS